ncbi:MAG: alanyl-tRNA editing protein [Candidatus Micrarchaeota archaeon]|nr:alanyl-tRNA editing protein [Candidatus Micrarchaeota archaeon]
MEALYMDDSYLKEFDAKVVSVKDGKFVVLDRTAFYPNGGGQPYDTGKMIRGDEEFPVVFVGKFSGQISHEVGKEGLKEGDEVHCIIDWDRRYRLMKMHTTAHIVSTIINKETGALITGNQLGLDKSRIDFSLENFDREAFAKYIEMVNDAISRNLDVAVSSMPRSEVEANPKLVKLAKGLPPGIETLRMVKIGDVDIQPDGGTHVKNTSEIGKVELVKLENKGKNNRRLYFTLV